MKIFNSLLSILAIIVLIGYTVFINKTNNNWTVVKQRGVENYGYTKENGLIYVEAGFTNKESAWKAMKREKSLSKLLPEKPSIPTSIWEPIK
mgnify:FL=1